MATTRSNELQFENTGEETDKEESARTSHSLILRAKENDPDSWNRLVQLYSPMVYFWCQQSGLSKPDLHDVFQDVFHTLARNIGKYRRVEGGTFRGWLRTMTRNKLNDHYRKCGRDPNPAGGTEALARMEQFPAAIPEDSEVDQRATPRNELEIQHSLLRQALGNIRENFTDQTWNAFWMVVVDGRETADVASELGMRPGTVRVAKSRVLKRLRLEIGESME